MLIGDVIKWLVNLVILLLVELCDVMVYFLNDCGWEVLWLIFYRKDNGYKLYRDNYISDVIIVEVLDFLLYFYVKVCCVLEIR